MTWRGLFGFIFFALGFSLHGADVDDFSIAKGRHYVQLGPSRVDIQTNNAYRFNVIVDPFVVGSVQAVRVTTPAGGAINGLPDADGSPWRVRERYDYPFDLENNFPNGAFTLTIVAANDGERNLGFNITGDQYPNAPLLNDYDAAQAVPVNAYKLFSWQPFAGGTAADFIQFTIEDVNDNTVFETPDFGEEGALTGLATTCLMPPGTLRAGRQYVGQIRFVKVLFSGHRAYPSVIGYAGYFTRTEFLIHSVSGPTRGTIDTLQAWKTRRFEYSVDGTLVDADRPWQFSVRGRAVTPNTIDNGTLTMPSPAGTRPLEVNLSRDEFEYEDDQLVTEQALHTAYPNGRYTVTLNRVDGAREDRPFDFPASAFPPPPSIQNRTAFQGHRAENDLVITWMPWAGASEYDFIRVEAQDENGVEAFDTPGFTRPGHLRGTATSAVIPGGTLLPGFTYELTVVFYKVTALDLSSTPGGIIYSGYATRTKLRFTTTPPDLLSTTVGLGRRLWQRGADVFEPDPTRPFEFTAMGVSSGIDSVTALSMTTPRSENISLPQFGQTFLFTANDASLGSLTARFPAGDFRFQAQTAHDGLRSTPVNLGSTAFPPIPQIRNFSSLATLRTTTANTIFWDIWPGADTNTDYVVVTLQGAAGATLPISSRPAGHPEALQGTLDRFTIPVDTLTLNRSYTVRVRFERLSRGLSADYPGVRAATSLFSETAFYISTLNAATFRAVLPTLSNGNFQFRLQSPLQNRTYRLDATSNFLEWRTVQTYLGTAAPLIINQPPDQPAAFFRLVLLP